MTQLANFNESRIVAERRIEELISKGHKKEVENLESLINCYIIFDKMIKGSTNGMIQKFPIWHCFLKEVPDLEATSALALIAGIEDISSKTNANLGSRPLQNQF